MIIHKLSRRAGLLAALLLSALLLCGCGGGKGDPYALTLWYAADDPLAPAAQALCEAWNASRPGDALPLSLREFENEERLLSALQSGAAPALALLSHEAAFSLAESALLVDPGVAADYPAWLRERADCVGHGCYPLGFSLPLLCASEPAPGSLSSLLEAAARGEGRLAIGCYAPVFYQALLDEGLEFAADFDRTQDQNYVNLYNTVAEAAFTGGLERSDDAPWHIAESATLLDADLSGRTLRALSEGELLAEGRCLAVTVRDTRMQRALPAFLRWLLSDGRAASAALDAGLVPALPDALSASDTLGETLLALRERPLHLPDGGSLWAKNRADFETRISAALELLR